MSVAMSPTIRTRAYSSLTSDRLWLVLKWLAAALVAVVAVFPLWWMFNVVFAEAGVPVSTNPRLYPTSFSAGFEKIWTIFAETAYLRAYYVSVMYTVLTIAGLLIVSAMAAFEFALFEFPGKRILFALVMVSLMVPQAVTLIPTYLLVADLGWVNTMQGLVVPGIASAFGLFMLTQFMQSIPKKTLEAGRLEGANHFQLFWYIALPLSKNALITLAILTFMKTWGNFIWPLVISVRQDSYTVSQVINLFNSPFSHTTIDVVMTANFLAAIPPLIFFLFFQRKIIEGVQMSGNKG